MCVYVHCIIYTSVRLVGVVTCEVKSLCVNGLLSAANILCKVYTSVVFVERSL